MLIKRHCSNELLHESLIVFTDLVQKNEDDLYLHVKGSNLCGYNVLLQNCTWQILK